MTPDLLIAGGGPAGAMLAILAGRAGMTAYLFDAARFPRDKACGEGLMPAGVGVLQRAGLCEQVGGVRFGGVRYRGFDIVAETAFPPPPRARAAERSNGIAPAAFGLGQRRLVLDQALLAAARATPNVSVFEHAPVEDVVQRAGRAVGLRIGGRDVRGRVIVGADGARSRVRLSLGLQAPPPRHPRWGVRVHFRLGPDARRAAADRIEIFVGEGHEIYVTPLPDGEVLVAALCERTPAPEADGWRDHGREEASQGDGAPPGPLRASAGPLLALISRHPELVERLRDAIRISSPRGRFPLSCRAVAGVAPGAVLIGDAAGFIDPITGGGMAQALLSAELLVGFLPRALASQDDEWLWRFDRRRRRLLRDYLLLTGFTLQLARRPVLARAMLRFMRGNPGFMRHLVGVAGGLRRLTG
jgi:2-polyprenyl-6-methoxyphenol hydroxylase-like FAD-dependent oxidoreductase